MQSDYQPIGNLDGLSSGTSVYLLGIVNKIGQITTKTGRWMAFVSPEDTSGHCD